MEQKTCKNCEGVFPVSEFYSLSKRGKNGQVWRHPDSYCIVCRKDYGKQRRVKLKQQAVEYLGGKCSNCGLKTTNIEVYDFHHSDPTQKDMTIAQAANRLFENIAAELDKCTLLCANCHRIEHARLQSA
jgi:hypothetical protein